MAATPILGVASAAIAHYTRYLAQDLGPPFGITANCTASGVIATERIIQTVIPGSSQSNRNRAELVALRRLGAVADCAKVVEFVATDLSDYVTGAVSQSTAAWCAENPVAWRGICCRRECAETTLLLYKKYTFHLYSKRARAGSRLLIFHLKITIGVPKGIRTPVTAVKGRCPRPLDDGDAAPG